MNKICTNIKQSKRLIELRVDVNTADMDYVPFVNDPAEYDCTINEWNNEHEEDWIPSWSLSALLELLPKHIKQEDGRIYKFHIFNDDGRVIQRWGCSYVAEDYHNRAEYLSDTTLKYPTNVYSGKYDNPLDAVFEMVCWLKENNKL